MSSPDTKTSSDWSRWEGTAGSDSREVSLSLTVNISLNPSLRSPSFHLTVRKSAWTYSQAESLGVSGQSSKPGVQLHRCQSDWSRCFQHFPGRKTEDKIIWCFRKILINLRWRWSRSSRWGKMKAKWRRGKKSRLEIFLLLSSLREHLFDISLFCFLTF